MPGVLDVGAAPADARRFNDAVAARLTEAAALLRQQGANPYRVRAYERAADSVRRLRVSASEMLRVEGLEGLERLPGIGHTLALAIRDVTRLGYLPMLERLRGDADPVHLLASVPGIGRRLAVRIHETLGIETLADLEAAATDGRLARLPGFGPKRLEGVRTTLAERLTRVRRPAAGQPPPVGELLDVDREYREAAAADRLPRLAPRRFNPHRRRWLPILHTARGARHYTALFSNTALAHRLARTNDWVVIHADDGAVEGQWTVVTARAGPWRGHRIVRGRETECAGMYADARPASDVRRVRPGGEGDPRRDGGPLMTRAAAKTRSTIVAVVAFALVTSGAGRIVSAIPDAGTAAGLDWVDESGRPTDDARIAVTLVGRAWEDGLDPDDYGAARLARQIAALDHATGSATEATAFDAALTDAMLALLHDLHLGRVDPAAVGFRLEAVRETHDFAEALRTARLAHALPDLVQRLRPPLAQYGALRQALTLYRALERDPAFAAPLPSPVQGAVHEGDGYAGAAVLSARLAALGDLPPAVPQPRADPTHAASPARTDATRYTAELAEGVRRFQLRHGLDADGVLGRATLAALDVPVARRRRQIELSLERLRWLPDFDAAPLVAINIPMFQLRAWDRFDSASPPAVSMRVVVGKALNTQTPVFTAMLREVVFRPFWNVPRSIVRGEILPALSRNAGYLAAHRYQIVDGERDAAPVVRATPENLARLREGTLRLRQAQGPDNALGLVKFVFPNEHDVYMHGTPARELFARSRRDFSHGCVRLEDPDALAAWLFRDQPDWTADRIALAETTPGPPVHVPLTAPVPVALFYTTALVTPDGGVHFADDIYGHDARLERQLERVAPVDGEISRSGAGAGAELPQGRAAASARGLQFEE